MLEGVLPSATRTRQRLVCAGLVNRPQRGIVDGMQRRIVWLESALPKVEPHEKIRPLIADYAVRVRAIADQRPTGYDDQAANGERRRSAAAFSCSDSLDATAGEATAAVIRAPTATAATVAVTSILFN